MTLASASAEPVRAAPFEVPAPFGAMFETGRTWTVAIESSSQLWDADTNRSVTNRTTLAGTCRVETVVDVGWAHVSEVACVGVEDDGVAQPIEGIWVMTADGLYHPEARPPDASALTPADRRFPNPIQASREESVDAIEPRFRASTSVGRSGDRWCWEHKSWGGDEGWQSLCIDENHGLVSASWGWAGGSVHEHELVVTSSTR